MADAAGKPVFACRAALGRVPAVVLEPGSKLTELACAGSLNAGMLLESVEQGARQVLVLGCAEGACRHEKGTAIAVEQVRLAQQLLATLGLDPGLIVLELVDREGVSAAVPCHRMRNWEPARD